MEKKLYNSPIMTAVEVQAEQFIAASDDNTVRALNSNNVFEDEVATEE